MTTTQQIEDRTTTVMDLIMGLTQFLADTVTLQIQSQSYHWNVEGPQFYSLHKLFEEQYRDLFEATDEIAERIRALGHKVSAGVGVFRDLTTLEERTLPLDAAGMLAALINSHQILKAQAQQVLEMAQQQQDEVTADLMIERLTVHQKAIWMLKSSL